MAPQEIDLALPGFALSVRDQDGYTIAAISGELDIASAPVLREQILGLPRPQARRIVIDLSGVTFCDASGLALLVGASRRARQLDGVLRLAALPPLVATLLRLTGLDSRFEIFATVPEAIGARPRQRDLRLPGGAAAQERELLGGQVTALADRGDDRQSGGPRDRDVAHRGRVPGPPAARR